MEPWYHGVITASWYQHRLCQRNYDAHIKRAPSDSNKRYHLFPLASSPVLVLRFCFVITLEDQNIEVLPWPAQSADLNPIEQVWDILKVQIGRRETRPTSIHDLWNVVLEEWELISLDRIQGLYESMPRRVEAVLKAKGGHTKY